MKKALIGLSAVACAFSTTAFAGSLSFGNDDLMILRTYPYTELGAIEQAHVTRDGKCYSTGGDVCQKKAAEYLKTLQQSSNEMGEKVKELMAFMPPADLARIEKLSDEMADLTENGYGNTPVITDTKAYAAKEKERFQIWDQFRRNPKVIEMVKSLEKAGYRVSLKSNRDEMMPSIGISRRLPAFPDKHLVQVTGDKADVRMEIANDFTTHYIFRRPKDAKKFLDEPGSYGVVSLPTKDNDAWVDRAKAHSRYILDSEHEKNRTTIPLAPFVVGSMENHCPAASFEQFKDQAWVSLSKGSFAKMDVCDLVDLSKFDKGEILFRPRPGQKDYVAHIKRDGSCFPQGMSAPCDSIGYDVPTNLVDINKEVQKSVVSPSNDQFIKETKNIGKDKVAPKLSGSAANEAVESPKAGIAK